jgi:hypothetical protein
MNRTKIAVRQQIRMIMHTVRDMRSIERIRKQLSNEFYSAATKAMFEVLYTKFALLPVKEVKRLKSCAHLLVVWHYDKDFKALVKKFTKRGTINVAFSQFLILLEVVRTEQQIRQEMYSLMHQA